MIVQRSPTALARLADIAYATSKGWTDESGVRVRAHIEYTRPQGD